VLWWQPALGHYFGLRPGDMRGLYVGQYVDCMTIIQKIEKARRGG
jgi:hypothetical protein